MACACSKGRSTNPGAGQPAGAKFVHTDPTTGKQTTYGSVYEAQFAQLKAGGGAIVPATAA